MAMGSPALLNFDELLAPIPGFEDPAGADVPFEVRQRLNEDRREVIDAREEFSKAADWPGVIRTCREVLSRTSKNLEIGARLTEALFQQHGFGGLRDGLRLLHLLVDQCWERLYPPLGEPEALETRADHVNLLNQTSRNWNFPDALRLRPLFRNREGAFSFLDWERSQEVPPRGPMTAADFQKKVIGPEKLETFIDLSEDAIQGLAELDGLIESLTEKMGPEAPRLETLRQALSAGSRFLEHVVAQKSPASGPAVVSAEERGTSPVVSAGLPAQAPSNRAEVYRQLAQAAEVLQQLEPHSPVPYLIRRAVELGDLPFPDMIRKLIREATVLAELDRELGIIKEQPSEAGSG
jgi:type VI secretion system protein ImpA